MTAGAQDYVSEVLYPDDLIPVEDIEGKFDYCFSLFELFIKISIMSRQFQDHQLQQQLQQQQLQQQCTMKTKMIKVILTGFQGQTFKVLLSHWNPHLRQWIYSN